MRLDATTYNFTQQIQGMIYQAMQPRLKAALPPLPMLLQIRRGYAESPAWFMVQAAEFLPEPLTVENLRVRDVYANPRIVQAILEFLAGERWLARLGEAYHLTNNGRMLLDQLKERTALLLASPPDVLNETLLNELEAALGRIIEASLTHDNPPGTWCLRHSRNRAPEDDAPPLLKINQYFSDLNAFRDDAHMAAWRSQAIDAHAWEAFSLLATQQANSAVDVYEALFFRGHTVEAYALALEQCEARGWLQPRADGSFMLTPYGEAVHQDVEAATDRYFYQPWYNLDDSHLEEVDALMQTLYQSLKTVIEEGK